METIREIDYSSNADMRWLTYDLQILFAYLSEAKDPKDRALLCQRIVKFIKNRK